MILTEEQAYLILKQKIDIHKDYQTISPSGRKHKLPEYYEGYNKVVEEYESIRVHSVAGVFPEKLMGERSPNQTKEEYEYAKANYQQTSNLPVFMDSVNTIQRSFNDGNWSIKYDNEKETSESYERYVTEEVPVYHSIENYVRFVLPANKLRDAMGVSVVKPKIYYKQSEEAIIEDDQQLRKPEILYYECPHVWSNTDEDYYVIKNNEYTKLEGTDKGCIIWIVDEVNFFVFHQKGKLHDWYFELVEVIPHYSGTIPVKRLQGVPVVHANKLFWQSPFLFCVPALNTVVLDESYLQISKYKVGYPTRIIAANICEFIDPQTNDNCIDGWLGINGTKDYRQCPKCKGSGQRSRLSPQAEILLKGGSRENNYQSENIDNVLKYVSPDTEPMKFLREEIKDNLKHARVTMHLNPDGEAGVGENVEQSTNKNKALNAFIKPISDQMFAHYKWELHVTGMQRYGEDYPKPVLIEPQSFDFLTDTDYLVLIKQAQDASAPSFVIASLIWKYLSSIFFTDLEAAKITSVIMRTDRLITMTESQVNNALISDLAAPWEIILHQSSQELIQEIVLDVPDYLDLEYEKQRELLITRAREKANEVNPVLLQTGGTTNTLKNTVGGLSGMIEITKAVAEGYYDLDAAIALVQDRFGLSEEDARKQLGTPNPILVQQNNGFNR